MHGSGYQRDIDVNEHAINRGALRGMGGHRIGVVEMLILVQVPANGPG
jgi:hypothetical protein